MNNKGGLEELIGSFFNFFPFETFICCRYIMEVPPRKGVTLSQQKRGRQKLPETETAMGNGNKISSLIAQIKDFSVEEGGPSAKKSRRGEETSGNSP